MMMDNLFLVSTAGTGNFLFQDSNCYFAPQGVYTNYAAGGMPQVETNDGLFSPSVMHFHGTFDTTNAASIQMKIFFDFVEPLPMQVDSDLVDCKASGWTVLSCRLIKGIPDVHQVTYTNHNGSTGTLRSYNSRFGYALMVTYTATTAISANKFSLVFPYKGITSSNIENMVITDYASTLYGWAAFATMDNTFTHQSFVTYSMGAGASGVGQRYIYPVMDGAHVASNYWRTSGGAGELSNPSPVVQTTIIDSVLSTIEVGSSGNIIANAGSGTNCITFGNGTKRIYMTNITVQ